MPGTKRRKRQQRTSRGLGKLDIAAFGIGPPSSEGPWTAELEREWFERWFQHGEDLLKRPTFGRCKWALEKFGKPWEPGYTRRRCQQ